MSARTRRSSLDLPWDLGALAGLGAIGVGAWWISPPLSLITVGALVLLGCLLGGRGDPSPRHPAAPSSPPPTSPAGG